MFCRLLAVALMFAALNFFFFPISSVFFRGISFNINFLYLRLPCFMLFFIFTLTNRWTLRTLNLFIFLQNRFKFCSWPVFNVIHMFRLSPSSVQSRPLYSLLSESFDQASHSDHPNIKIVLHLQTQMFGLPLGGFLGYIFHLEWFGIMPFSQRFRYNGNILRNFFHRGFRGLLSTL